MYVVVASPGWRGYRVTVYDDGGRRVAEERLEAEQLELRGMRGARLVRGMGGVGLVVIYESKPCLERRGSIIEVVECGAGSREE